jgi:L-seryl-tRNA(Ser) seleniumtransferase
MTQAANPYRELPQVDALLADPRLAGHEAPHELRVRLVQAVLERARGRIAAGWPAPEVAAWRDGGGALEEVLAELERDRGRGVRPIVNATGVVLNTGLGRAPVHPEAAAAMAAAAGSYCVLEVDRFTGERNRRDDRLSELLSRLTGAEAAIAVNNCAAAVVLTLAGFARGRGAVLSRGELVEIGGSFRMPDVMEQAGVRLIEVGTTNKTHEVDYARALDVHADAALLLKVHRSNFRVRGFTKEVDAAELARLGAERGVPVAFDLGSGRFDPPGAAPLDMLGDEPRLEEALASGVDVVMHSGDKLLGGPQAGLILGRRQAVDALRANPLYRALRLDKVTLAGLERTVELMLAGRGDELPVRRMLLREASELEPEARALASALSEHLTGTLAGCALEVAPQRSQPGSGSAPDVFLDTWAVRLAPADGRADRLARRLRAGDPAVFARVHEDALWLDVRTLLPGDAERLVQAFRGLSGSERSA